MNAPIDTIVAESTHSRIDWEDPTANEHVDTSTGPIVVLRDAAGSFIAVEAAVEDANEVTPLEPVTLVQHMSSADLRRKCVVWAVWDGVKSSGLWDATPKRMPLYAVEPSSAGAKETAVAEPAKPKRKPRAKKPAAKKVD